MSYSAGQIERAAKAAFELRMEQCNNHRSAQWEHAASEIQDRWRAIAVAALTAAQENGDGK